MTSEALQPPGNRFVDLNSFREMIYVNEEYQSWKGWIFFLHPDGKSWVSLREATENDKRLIEERAMKAGTNFWATNLAGRPSGLSFSVLRDKNVARSEDVFHKLHDWSLTDWGCAMGGECGEVLNVIKKIRRLYDDVKRGFAEKLDEELKHELAMELADTIIYADLLAARAGIDLGEAIREKFNLVSDNRGSEIRL